MVKVGINGCGRIGCLVFRIAYDTPNCDLVAVNNPGDIATLAHLLKYDSVHGVWKHDVTVDGDCLVVDGTKKIKVFSTRNPEELPWGEYGVEVVIESTGKIKDKEGCSKHIASGAKKVVITAPGKEEDITIVMGVNEEKYDPAKHHILSNASCTTNCLAPVAKVLLQKFGIENGLMTTVHSYTNDQNTLDHKHKDLRRARAAGCSIIPTTTGAAKAVAKVLPELKGKLNGFAMRVPTPNVSVVDLVANLSTDTTVEEINAALKEASETYMKGILGYNELPLVSKDYNGCEISSIVDGLSTMMIGSRMCKVVAWYDNEWGYSCRVVDLAMYVGSKL